MKVQLTNFTKVSLLLWEYEICYKRDYEKDTDLNHRLRNARLQYLLQKLCMYW